MLFPRCRAQLTLTPDEIAHLQSQPEAAHQVVLEPTCELELDHPGLHLSLGQALADDREIWLEWTADGGHHMVEPDDLCEAQETDSDDPWICELPSPHPGRHSFELEPGGRRDFTPLWGDRFQTAVQRLIGEEQDDDASAG